MFTSRGGINFSPVGSDQEERIKTGEKYFLNSGPTAGVSPERRTKTLRQ